MSNFAQWTQRENEKSIFNVNLVDWLGDATKSSAALAKSDAGITATLTESATVVQAKISGGTVGETYKVSITVTASDARISTFWAVVTIQAKIEGVA